MVLLFVYLFQHKNASSILEFERVAESGFEKRDFRKASSPREIDSTHSLDGRNPATVW